MNADERVTRHAPVILLAPARSQSSVVAAMIGSHPQLYGFPELILFDYATIGERLDAPPRVGKRPPGFYALPGLVRALAQVHDGDQGPEAIAAAKHWVEEHRDCSGATVFDHLLDLVAPLIGVEKSPETVNSEEQLHRALAAFPAARFIHLARHPVTAQRSLHVRWMTFDRPEVFALSWWNQHRRISKFCAELPAEQSIVVRSEDALNASASEMRRIARWLSVRDDDEAIDAMRHPERSPYSNAGCNDELEGNDPRFLRSPAPHPVELPATLAHPPEWRLPTDLTADVAEVATSLGYQDRPFPPLSEETSKEPGRGSGPRSSDRPDVGSVIYSGGRRTRKSEGQE